MIKTLSIIIPVYNESDTLTDLLDRVLHVALPVKREIIVVNDGSTDDSRQLAEAGSQPSMWSNRPTSFS